MTWFCYVAGLISSGIVNGITPTLIAPEKSVTRAELLTMLDRAIIQVISSPGTYELAAQARIILISSGDVDRIRQNTGSDPHYKRCRRRSDYFFKMRPSPDALPCVPITP
ncbi:MAG: S-layer homology domain-containing protein [Butyricicoccaceae bacterium]